MESGRSDGDATLWRLIAEFRGENNQRDVKLEKLAGQVALALDQRQQLSDLKDDLDHLEASTNAFRREFETAAVRTLTREKVLALERLYEQLQTRGTIDLFTQSEMETIRSTLRHLDESRIDYEKMRGRVADLERLRDDFDARLDNRLKVLASITTRIDNLEAWHDAHREDHEAIQSRLYKLEFAPGLSADEVSSHREMLTHWQKFFLNALPDVEAMLVWWRKTQTRAGVVSNNVVNAMFQIALVTPVLTIIVILLHKLFGA